MSVAATPEVRITRPAALPAPGARFVVVEASAGTGKTFFLEHRVVDLVLAGSRLAEILLVTFTEKAVAELRLRVRDLLDRLSRATVDTAAPDDATAWVIDKEARGRLRAAVADFDQAPIYTIHGFCQRILVEDAFAAARLFEQVQVADEVAFDAAFLALVRERFARAEPDRSLLHAYLATGRTLTQLRDVLLACARAGSDARVYRSYDPDAVCAAGRALRDALGSELRRASVLGSLATNRNRRFMVNWLDEIGAVFDGLPADATAPQVMHALGAMREPLGKVLEKAQESAAHPGLAETILALMEIGTLDQAIAAVLLPAVLDRVARDKAERGQFDYDDMLRLVWGALRGERGTDLAARLRARTPVAMIDEFQDTDPLQWSIFRDVWTHAEARGLTIVGDPKQAIYGFRGADVHTYLAAREELLAADAERVALTVNRRSTAPLVAAVNQILGGPLAMQLLTGAITYDEPVTASGDLVAIGIGAPVAVMKLVPDGSGKATAEATRAALARGIGDAIERLRATRPTWQRRGAEHVFSLGDCMVLTRSNRESSEIAAALRARGLPCALVEPEKLFETREAHELAAVLAAIAAPRDRSARLRALRTRFFDVPWAELARVVDAPDHHPLTARIFEWTQLASRRAYESLFRRLVEDSHYAERALVLGGGERALTNTWHLIELLLAEVARSRSDLHELVAVLRRWTTDETSRPDERDVQRAETDADAIRILTIHKAKGLEAAFVFLYGGASGGKSSTVKVLRTPGERTLIVGAHEGAIATQIARADDEENQRLAYVALTRAQVRMYLPLFANVSSTAAYYSIQRCLDHCVQQGANEQFELIEIAIGAPELPLPGPDALASFTVPRPPATASLAPLAAARAGLTTLSYTRLARDHAEATAPSKATGTGAIDAAEFHEDAVTTVASERIEAEVEAPTSELPPGADAGLLLHDVLEVVDLACARSISDAAIWAQEPEVAHQLADAARARGIPARFLPHAAAIVHRTLTRPLTLVDGTELPPLVAADALAREVEFAYPYRAVAGGGGLVRGFIDALVVYGDELWVLDYKSDALAATSDPDGDPDDRTAAARTRVDVHYDVQMRLYALAADRMRGGQRLAGLLFVFVRYGVVVAKRVDEAQLAAWAAWLAALPAAPEVVA